jgi:hypothetical protein
MCERPTSLFADVLKLYGHLIVLHPKAHLPFLVEAVSFALGYLAFSPVAIKWKSTQGYQRPNFNIVLILWFFHILP